MARGHYGDTSPRRRTRSAAPGTLSEVAIAAYSYVIDVWRHADSVLLINYVAPARERLRRLTEEPRRD